MFGRWALGVCFRMRGMRLGQISVIDRLDDSSGDFFHIATLQDPIAAQGAEALVSGQASRSDRPMDR